MQIPVIVERLANNGFRVRGTEPFQVSVEAPTRDEALARWKEQLQVRLKNGAEVVGVDVAAEPHPWMEFAGMFDPNDPMVQAWEKDMTDYRRKIDQHPDSP